jgi:hypothetical protein
VAIIFPFSDRHGDTRTMGLLNEAKAPRQFVIQGKRTGSNMPNHRPLGQPPPSTASGIHVVGGGVQVPSVQAAPVYYQVV